MPKLTASMVRNLTARQSLRSLQGIKSHRSAGELSGNDNPLGSSSYLSAVESVEELIVTD